ncbi:hypothetical protein KGF57_001082 [Candida theae]|uniref:Uncharacterized protein n=1 Tax=Candida theae TaxID=1198502 RepID=A0AAD5BHS4_9ASCO|nr:uncharacterized protein KGF57_001082 [Candida theae]KAI5964409.1 hypothetical protein KGF57_001082 [Candida theae]
MAYPELTCGLRSVLVPMAPNNENAFNPCFFTAMLSIFAMFTFIWGGFTFWRQWTSPHHSNYQLANVGISYYTRVASVLLQVILFAYISSFVSIHERLADQKIIAFGLTTLAMLCVILPLHILENLKSPIQLDILLVFWPCFTVFAGALYFQDNYTDWVIIQSVKSISLVEIAVIANSINIFVLEYFKWSPSKYLIEEYKITGHKDLLEQPNLLQRITFTWMNELIVNSYKNKTVTNTELPNTPKEISTVYSTAILQKHWYNGNLLTSLFNSFGKGLSVAFGYELAARALNFTRPQLLRFLILFFTIKNPPLLRGVLICVGIFANTVAQNALNNKYMLRNLENILNIRSSLTSMVYKKTLKLSSEARLSSSSGDIINLMSVDINRISYAMTNISTLIIAPFDIILGLISLWPLLGVSTFAGFVAIIVALPINAVLVKYITNWNRQQMKLKDERTGVINEILTSIKSIKLFAWEKPMLRKLSKARNDHELKNLVKVRFYNQISNFVWSLIPILMNLLCFGSYVLTQKKPLTSDIVFPALTLLSLVSNPILEFSETINSYIEGKVALARVRKFLVNEELDSKAISRVVPPSADNSDEYVVVEIKNASFYWTRPKYQDDEADEVLDDESHALKDVNLEVPKGSMSCIIGKVGSGKTSLLYALLGQMVCIRGELSSKPVIKVHGSVAYCAQSPWIMNASVKENILFGCRLEPEFYRMTIEACQLEQDLKILPDGDETQVGEKGVSLSGGQKARLALARAVYARADIYLLDDILSAVDSHVGKKIIDQVLSKNGLLGSKTIILCTNSISVLKYSDSVTMIEKGKIVESVPYLEVDRNNHPKIYNLITTFGKDTGENSSGTTSTPSSELEPLLVPMLNSDSQTLENNGKVTTLRRASIESFHWDPLQKLLPNLKSGSTQEQSQKGKVKWEVYTAYIKACSIGGIFVWIGFIIMSNLLSIGSNYWLKHWTEENSEAGENKDIWNFLLVYAALGVGATFMTVGRSLIMRMWLGINASRKIHNQMAARVIGAPMEFFERTPVGRIMNRFTNDINRIDDGIPSIFSAFISQISRTVFTLVVVSFAIPAYFISILILGAIYAYYEIYYVAISRELKRLVSVSRSPIYGHLGESLNGMDTIRAYGQNERFDFIMNKVVDFNLKSQYMLTSINRWLFFRLQVVGGLAVLSASSMLILSVKTAHPLTSSMAGFLMTYALQVTGSLRIVVRQSAEVETSIVAVERCLEYTQLPVEEDEQKQVFTPPLDWYKCGNIQFNDYSTRYRENLDLVLKNVNLTIAEGDKVGVVGRTGAGKSSLALAIFRIIEPVEGNIDINGINTSAISLHELRHHLSIIPQDSQLFQGTIRQNLDPFNYYTDDEIWRALELAHLKDHIAQLNSNEVDDADKNDLKTHVSHSNGNKLLCKVNEGGSNFSAGQRQLMSLARVLLKMNESQVLVLDEATAAVDVETDRIIQETIRKEFKDKTIVTIAHRLETVMDSDRILALDEGEVVEFDTPSKLIESKRGIFYGLCEQGGYL